MAIVRKAVWFISGIETLKALGTVPKDYKPPACEAIDLTMEDSFLGSASTNIEFQVSQVPSSKKRLNRRFSR
jgi:hypothetical protein